MNIIGAGNVPTKSFLPQLTHLEGGDESEWLGGGIVAFSFKKKVKDEK